MKLSYRFANPGDAAALLKIYAPYVENTSITFEYDVPSEEEFARRIQSVTERFPWILCEDEGIPIGYAYASPAFTRAAYQWDAELSIYIDRRYHRSGIASRLEDMISTLLTEQGFHHLYSRVTTPNDASIGFHKARGFQEIGVYRNTGFKLGGWHDVIALEKDLLPCRSDQSPAPTKPLTLLDGKTIQKVFQTE